MVSRVSWRRVEVEDGRRWRSSGPCPFAGDDRQEEEKAKEGVGTDVRRHALQLDVGSSDDRLGSWSVTWTERI